MVNSPPGIQTIPSGAVVCLLSGSVTPRAEGPSFAASMGKQQRPAKIAPGGMKRAIPERCTPGLQPAPVRLVSFCDITGFLMDETEPSRRTSAKRELYL